MKLNYKKLICLVLSLITTMAVSSAVFAADSLEQVSARGVYIKQCVAYEPNYTSKVYTHKNIGFVSGDNIIGTSPMNINYAYESSGSTTASISTYANASAEAGVVFAKMSVEAGVEVAGSRSWTRGTSSGVSYSIKPGRFEELAVYIPAVKTAGRLKYKVYMDGYPNDYFYEYKTLSDSYAPQCNSLHFKVIYSGTTVPRTLSGTTIYTPSGKYIAE